MTCQTTTITDIRRSIITEKTTSKEITELFLERIKKHDEKLNSIIEVNQDAIKRAISLDQQYADSGLQGPLHGIPVVIKDNIGTEHMATTAGSIALKNATTSEDATSVKRIREAGGIILAKANLGEFATGSKSSLGGQVHNPYDLSRTPAGSSAGSGAALGAELAPVGLGTDTGGSVRHPTAFNCLVGIRPTRGLISRDGLVPVSPTQDTVGPMAHTVQDVAHLLNVLAGYDSADPVTARSVGNIPREGYLSQLAVDGLSNARIGILRDPKGKFIMKNTEGKKVETKVRQASKVMRRSGAEIIDPVEIPGIWKLAKDIDAIVKGTEFKPAMNEYLCRVENTTNTTVKSIVDSGDYVSTQDVEGRLKSGVTKYGDEIEEKDLSENKKYLKFYKLRDEVSNLLLTKMANNNLDAFVFPTYSVPPVRIGDHQTGSNTHVASAAGFPEITVPAGFTEEHHLPIGLEILGKPFDEPKLLSIAYSYEQATQFRHPPSNFPLSNDLIDKATGNI